MTKYTEAQKNCIKRYREDKANIQISKFVTAEKKQQYVALATDAGMSLTGYVFYLLDRELERNSAESE